jgi:CDP-diacylglycerol--glycerol-3-phosphate 3-phosphatidyltransferase
MPLSRASLRAAAASRLERPGARLLSRLGVTPNGVTLMGLALSVVSAGLIATGSLALGGVVLLMSAALDMMDGALARLTGRASDAGALLDSVADRVAEAAVLLGMLAFALGRGDATMAVLVNLAIVTSVLVSYIRARAEGLGVRGTVGLMTRPERVVVLAVGLLAGFPTVALGVIAAGSAATAAHRFLHAWTQLRRDHDHNR